MNHLLAIALANKFLAGLLIGGLGFGGALGIIGWTLGYDHAMRKVGGWMRPKIAEAQAVIPNLPPVRDRRALPTTPGRDV